MSLTSLWILFLVMLNPVALFLYLNPIAHTISRRQFFGIVRKATLIAGAIYALFIFSGDYIFLNIFQINFDSFRLFGGIVIFTMAFMFIVNGKEWFIQMKSDLDDMATQLALPFMVGAGSISVSILVWNEFPLVEWLGLLIAVLCINWFAIVTIRMMQGRFFEWKLKPYFDKILSVFFRLNSFFMGAVGIDMIITAVKWLFGI